MEPSGRVSNLTSLRFDLTAEGCQGEPLGDDGLVLLPVGDLGGEGVGFVVVELGLELGGLLGFLLFLFEPGAGRVLVS